MPHKKFSGILIPERSVFRASRFYAGLSCSGSRQAGLPARWLLAHPITDAFGS